MTYTVVYQETTGQLTISGTNASKIMTEEEARVRHNAGGLATYAPNQTAYSVVGWIDELVQYTLTLACEGMINVQSHNTLFLCSSGELSSGA